MNEITRRRWLMEALALTALPRSLWSLQTNEESVGFADYGLFKLDLGASHPRVRCFDLRQLSQPITPNADFFVFHQTTAPQVDVSKWSLEIGGFVERPGKFTMEELTGGGESLREIEVTIECSGNVPYKETMNGQISNARWSGISLASLLKRCGIRSEAREAVFFGADEDRDAAGGYRGPHARSVFAQDALDPDAILATKMNGVPLPPDHGFPMRVILPGWYGMAQIKWLTRIEVIDRRYEGPHMSRNYHSLHAIPAGGSEPVIIETSISRTRLKSVVARVTRRRRGNAWDYRIAGAAWGGLSPIERVEVCVDKGPWKVARIDERRGKDAWLLWSYEWQEATPGRHTLISRAIDADGKVQPTLDELWNEIKSARENNAQWEREIEIAG